MFVSFYSKYYIIKIVKLQVLYCRLLPGYNRKDFFSRTCRVSASGELVFAVFGEKKHLKGIQDHIERAGNIL